MARIITLIGAFALALAGCQAADPRPAVEAPAASPPAGGAADHSTKPSTAQPDAPVAFLRGQPLGWSALRPGLIEAAGGQVLVETVMERAIRQRLAERGITIGPEQTEAERAIMLQQLTPDANEAQRLLTELRQRRGWGERRFAGVLARNAGLRALVQNDVQVSDAAVQQAFRLEYGQRYEARLIVVETLTKAADVLREARAGKGFIDLAIAHSTDSSRAQGGLLPPISADDASFPAAVRTALDRLKPGDVSDPVALERGYAILKLERKIDAQPVKFDDVKQALTLRVRRQVERMLMQQMAREMLSTVDLLIMDPALDQSWKQQKRMLMQEE